MAAVLSLRVLPRDFAAIVGEAIGGSSETAGEIFCCCTGTTGVRQWESRRFFGGGHAYYLIGKHPLVANIPAVYSGGIVGQR